MAASTPAAVQGQIASGQLDPVYLILGDDEYQKVELAGGPAMCRAPLPPRVLPMSSTWLTA